MLNDLIRKLSLEKNTPAEVELELNAKSVTKTDRRLKFVRDLIDVVGATNANTVLESLQKAGRGDIPGVPAQLCLSEWHLLNGAGSDVGRPGVQAMLTGLGQLDAWPEGVADAVKAIGVWQVSPSQDAGLGTVTIEEVEESLAEIAMEDRSIDYRTRFDTALNQIGTPEQADAVADLRSIADEIEVG